MVGDPRAVVTAEVSDAQVISRMRTAEDRARTKKAEEMSLDVHDKVVCPAEGGSSSGSRPVEDSDGRR